jgi:conserved oligomeric Golgi complex subunit 2
MGDSGKTRLVRILGIYRDLGAEQEVIKVLKDLKSN